MTGPVAGAVGVARLTVGEQDTARALGSGDLSVLGSPRVAALAEAAALAAIAGDLEPEVTTVGTRVSLDHRAPTPVGVDVVACATLTAVEGRTLTFSIDVMSDGRVVARIDHDRVVVERERFLAQPALQVPARRASSAEGKGDG